MKYRKSFKRFPGISELAKVKEFTPSKGSVIFSNLHLTLTMVYLYLEKSKARKDFSFMEVML